MNQVEFKKLLLKYQAGQGIESERSMVEGWFTNLQSPKIIENPVETEVQIFSRINAGIENGEGAPDRWRSLPDIINKAKFNTE